MRGSYEVYKPLIDPANLQLLAKPNGELHVFENGVAFREVQKNFGIRRANGVNVEVLDSSPDWHDRLSTVSFCPAVIRP